MTMMLTELSEWHELSVHYNEIGRQTMQSWFAEDPHRFQRFSLQMGDILLDYSKNRITPKTLELLCQLANKVQLSDKISALFKGESINLTEKRPALHTALRCRRNQPLYINGQNVMSDIEAALTKMHAFTEKVRNREWLGITGKPVQNVVNIGIGGSYLGPEMVIHALSEFVTDSIRCHFISNIDSAHLKDVLKNINPETTLFILSSKSFTTLETETNIKAVRAWLKKQFHDIPESTYLPRHFVAVTAAIEKAITLGLPSANIFPIWDWVGGRYSVWGSTGLPVALMIGMDNFLEFLHGAHVMDTHFQEAEFSVNMPVILALIGIWYINFFNAGSHAIIPYSHHLNQLRAHLQQLDMESNGKSVSVHGKQISYATGPIIWGENGCNGQHAFHQLLHQGQTFVPVDFLLIGENHLNPQHDILIASALSQAQALLIGKTSDQIRAELLAEGYSKEAADYLSIHKSIPGNRPSNILFLNKLSPHSLGTLIALYEHKVFVQGAIWGINSFDQWGVELGKQLLPPILKDLTDPQRQAHHDGSTLGLIKHYKKMKSAVT